MYVVVLCHWFFMSFFLVYGNHITKKKKKVPALHTNVYHSQRSAAEDGKKTGSDQWREWLKKLLKAWKVCLGLERRDFVSHWLVNLSSVFLISKSPENHAGPLGSLLCCAPLLHPVGPPPLLSQIPLLTGSQRVQAGSTLSRVCLDQRNQRGLPFAWSSAGPPWSSTADTPWWEIYRSISSGRLQWPGLEAGNGKIHKCMFKSGSSLWECKNIKGACVCV